MPKLVSGGRAMRKALLIGAVFSSLAFATNGDNMIGVTPASRGMGGIGVGMPVGPVDSIFRNPAWMVNTNNKFSVQFGGILFMPKVKGHSKAFFDTNDGIDSGEVKSKADTFVVPEIGIVHKLSDRLAVGIGAFGVSGMGVDYRNQQSLNNMHTTFQFMRIIPSIAFKVNEMISLAGAVHGAWGSLDMGATMCRDADGDMAPGTCWNAGGGQSQSLGVGFQLGASLNFGDFLYAGLTYQSPVSMTYKKVFDSNDDRTFEDMKLQQPQELALGLGVAPLNNLKVGLDIRWINWKNADGYKHFQWDDQWVYAIGAEFKPTTNLALRAGYNYGKSPIKGGAKNVMNANNIPNFAAPFSDYYVAWFNLIGFPAITEQHITLGLGYEFTKNFGVDLAYKHAFNKKVTATDNAGMGLMVQAQNAQDAVSIGLNWKF